MLIQQAKNELNKKFDDLKDKIRSGSDAANEEGEKIAKSIESLGKLESIGVKNTWELLEMIPGLIDDLQRKVEIDKLKAESIAAKSSPRKPKKK